MEFAVIIYPFYVLTKVFETDCARQYRAVPIFEHLENNLQNLSKYVRKNIKIFLWQCYNKWDIAYFSRIFEYAS